VLSSVLIFFALRLYTSVVASMRYLLFTFTKELKGDQKKFFWQIMLLIHLQYSNMYTQNKIFNFLLFQVPVPTSEEHDAFLYSDPLNSFHIHVWAESDADADKRCVTFCVT
jgi:hypothetical protein